MSTLMSTSMTLENLYREDRACKIGGRTMASRRARGRRSYHHKDLRAALIETATALISERGAAAFSLREAARVVGVDAAACYRHFRDREDVLVAIAQLGFREL